MSKLNLGIIFGGKSAEHEVSLQSAYNIAKAVDKEKYDLTLIAMDKEGRFFLCDNDNFIENKDDPKDIKLASCDNEISFILGENGKSFYSLRDNKTLDKIDVIFPIIHGPFGEDGSLQGLLKLINIPYVGSDIIGSSVGMDKDIMKRLLRDADIKISDFLVYRSINEANFKVAKEKLGLPMFVKPANLGSSVGVSKVVDEKSYIEALKNAFRFDKKIIIEEFIDGREIECAVKGNLKIKLTVPGEILPAEEFYSYEAKYVDDKGAKLEIPAKLEENVINEIKDVAFRTYKVLETKGLARIDFFVNDDGVIVNEINTLPGFTKISMYPKLWGYEGLEYSKLIDELIELAIDEFKLNNNLLTSV